MQQHKQHGQSRRHHCICSTKQCSAPHRPARGRVRVGGKECMPKHQHKQHGQSRTTLYVLHKAVQHVT
jgi:hypothetical protein